MRSLVTNVCGKRGESLWVNRLKTACLSPALRIANYALRINRLFFTPFLHDLSSTFTTTKMLVSPLFLGKFSTLSTTPIRAGYKICTHKLLLIGGCS